MQNHFIFEIWDRKWKQKIENEEKKERKSYFALQSVQLEVIVDEAHANCCSFHGFFNFVCVSGLGNRCTFFFTEKKLCNG